MRPKRKEYIKMLEGLWYLPIPDTKHRYLIEVSQHVVMRFRPTGGVLLNINISPSLPPGNQATTTSHRIVKGVEKKKEKNIVCR